MKTDQRPFVGRSRLRNPFHHPEKIERKLKQGACEPRSAVFPLFPSGKMLGGSSLHPASGETTPKVTIRSYFLRTIAGDLRKRTDSAPLSEILRNPH